MADDISHNVEFSLPQKYKTDRGSPVRWILSHAIHQWPLVVFAVIAAIVNAYLASYSAVLTGDAFNAVLGVPIDISLLGRIALMIGIIQASRGVIQLFRNFSFELVAQKIERNVREELYLSLLGKSMTFHNLQSVGETMARATNDVREINYMFSPGVNLVVGSINFLIMPIIIAPSYHPSLILAPILFIIFYFIALWDYLKNLNPVTAQVRETFGKLNSRLAESLDGIETVKSAAREEPEISLFYKNASFYRDAAVRQGRIEARFLPLLLLSVATSAGLFHALILAKNGVLDIGQVVGYFGLLLLLDFPTFISIFAYSQISLGISSARRILELILQENNLDQNKAGYRESMKGELEFRNVSFAYREGENVLENISFHVKAGQTIAIVGQTGAGKTSLAKLVNRIFDVTKGSVLVDGVDVRDWNLEYLRKNISIIEQEIFLFSKSLKENISFGKPEADLNEVDQAALAAQAREFIEQMHDGYDTVVGERGVTLSGGQRQRIALARAFMTDPKVLILDDATSAIDSSTEDKIQQAIWSASQGRTTLIITHRLSQIRWADLIIVLKKGRVAAIGQHEDLISTSDAYRKIFSE